MNALRCEKQKKKKRTGNLHEENVIFQLFRPIKDYIIFRLEKCNTEVVHFDITDKTAV